MPQAVSLLHKRPCLAAPLSQPIKAQYHEGSGPMRSLHSGPRASRGSRNKQQQPVKTREQEEEEYLRRRRTDFMDDVSEETDYVKTFYENQKNPKGAVGTVYRSER